MYHSLPLGNNSNNYDLILKNKERLLSFEEPTRFIFSHSALREGWDNPNVFQICTLKQSDNQTAKRQEVGRGMALRGFRRAFLFANLSILFANGLSSVDRRNFPAFYQHQLLYGHNYWR